MEGEKSDGRPVDEKAVDAVDQVRALEGDRGLTVESEIAAGDAEADAQER